MYVCMIVKYCQSCVDTSYIVYIHVIMYLHISNNCRAILGDLTISLHQLLPAGYDGSLENESYPTSDEEEEPDEDESGAFLSTCICLYVCTQYTCISDCLHSVHQTYNIIYDIYSLSNLPRPFLCGGPLPYTTVP